MSKMDELRALREARYERTVSRAPASRVAAPKKAERPAAPTVGAEPPAAASETNDSETKLCGHRAISGRTCTREHGHAAKSHRYS